MKTQKTPLTEEAYLRHKLRQLALFAEAEEKLASRHKEWLRFLAEHPKLMQMKLHWSQWHS